MADLRRQLIRNYSEHYSRANHGLDPTRLAAAARAHLNASYGSIVATLPAGSQVLDLGCGTGYLLAWLSSFKTLRVVGVDSSESQVMAAARHLPDVRVECCDGIGFLRRHPSTFAAVFCLDVLEHIPDGELLEWLLAARDALVPGGYLVCKVPNAANLTSAQLRYVDLTHVRSFTGSSLRQLFETAGFAECDIRPVHSGRLTGQIRELVEKSLHKVLYRVCGEGREDVFTRTVIGLAQKGCEPA
jgi:2-polyprenyl-3-methyl-5-hydroxy-6-metoxy-1,4-benzoquinol methylase